MADGALERLLAGTFPDPDGPGTLPAPATRVAIGAGLAAEAAALVAPLGLGTRPIAVTDRRVRAAAGAAIVARLGVREFVLDDERPHADSETVARVREATKDSTGLIAIGAGTINDLCKYAAHLDAKPYAVFGTAPSMNGYTSPNAAITVDGLKKSLGATAARGVFLDLDVLAAAPVRLIRAGLGDSVCRPTAQFDWLLSHLLLGRPYRAAPFALLAEDEAALLAGPAGLVAGDRAALARLARTLVLSGFGMALCGGSWPASQGEHLISHFVDMLGAPDLPATLHGEQIGVTTLAMARLQHALLARERLALPAPATRADLVARFGEALGESCWAEFERKQAAAALARLADWPAIRTRLAAVALPVARLDAALAAAGAPRTPAELGWPAALWRRALADSRFIRDRFTALDLVAGSGDTAA